MGAIFPKQSAILKIVPFSMEDWPFGTLKSVKIGDMYVDRLNGF